MGDSGALPRFGDLDLDLRERAQAPLREDSRATYRPRADSLADEEELALGEAGIDASPEPPRPPPSTSRVYEIAASAQTSPPSLPLRRPLPAPRPPPDPFGGLIPVNGYDTLATLAPPPAAPAGIPTFVPPRLPPVSAPTPRLSLTDRHSIPRLLTSAKDVAKLPLDHHAGFLLAHVDGIQTLEEILDVCAMPPSKALELIARLKAMGVIEFE